MKKLPKTVAVAGTELEIDIRPKFEHMGEFLHDRRTIVINGSYPLEAQWQTLFHETLHAALYLSGQAEGLTGAKEEAIVIAIENSLWPIISFK